MLVSKFFHLLFDSIPNDNSIPPSLSFTKYNFPSEIFLLCIPINVLGVLYIIFILKEVDHSKLNKANGTASNGTSEGVDNPGFELKEQQPTNATTATNGNGTTAPVQVITKLKQNAFVDFFNPVVAVGCIQVILRKREYNGRVIIWLLLIMYFIAIGPAFGMYACIHVLKKCSTQHFNLKVRNRMSIISLVSF